MVAHADGVGRVFPAGDPRNVPFARLPDAQRRLDLGMAQDGLPGDGDIVGLRQPRHLAHQTLNLRLRDRILAGAERRLPRAAHGADGDADAVGIQLGGMGRIVLGQGRSVGADGLVAIDDIAAALDHQVIMGAVLLARAVRACGPVHDNAFHRLFLKVGGEVERRRGAWRRTRAFRRSQIRGLETP